MTSPEHRRLTRREFLALLLTGAGALATAEAWHLLHPAQPHPVKPAGTSPIKNVIIFIQENHSFDSLFGGFPGANGLALPNGCPDALPADPPHDPRSAQAPGGATTAASRCSYSEADAPNYWKLARKFALCDNYFSEVRGPSHPNYLMMIAAQSPIRDTPVPADECPRFCLDLPVLPEQLDARGLTWRDYGGIFSSIQAVADRPEVMDFRDDQFFVDAASGNLPNVSWLNSGFLHHSDTKSGHPPSSLCVGENYAVDVLNAVMTGSQWASTALFLVWDDWGGFYDHVDPPIVERWTDGTPFRYGFRVPCIAVSPYARSGYVSHSLHSHVSLLRFTEAMFGLSPLTQRDASASDLLDCFDFAQAPLAPLPLEPRSCSA